VCQRMNRQRPTVEARRNRPVERTAAEGYGDLYAPGPAGRSLWRARRDAGAADEVLNRWGGRPGQAVWQPPQRGGARKARTPPLGSARGGRQGRPGEGADHGHQDVSLTGAPAGAGAARGSMKVSG